MLIQYLNGYEKSNNFKITEGSGVMISNVGRADNCRKIETGEINE